MTREELDRVVRRECFLVEEAHERLDSALASTKSSATVYLPGRSLLVHIEWRLERQQWSDCHVALHPRWRVGIGDDAIWDDTSRFVAEGRPKEMQWCAEEVEALCYMFINKQRETWPTEHDIYNAIVKRLDSEDRAALDEAAR